MSSLPANVIRLYEWRGSEKILLLEQRNSPKGRDKVQRMYQDLLMTDPTLLLDIVENGARS